MELLFKGFKPTPSRLQFLKPRVLISTAIITLLSQSSRGAEANGITNLATNVICGKQLTRRPKVIGGEDAFRGEFPWLVSVKEKFGGKFQHICGGFIVSDRYIISAAHCFESYIPAKGRAGVRLDRLVVTIGEHDLGNVEVPMDAIDVGIEKLTIHPQFNIYGYVNDIAILKLHRDLEWSPYVWPACLSSSTFEPEEGQNGTVAGWGSLVDIVGDRVGEYPNVLQKATIPILSNSECRKWFRRNAVHWNPKDTHLCAGYLEGGRDACRGDSGSPFLVQKGADSVVIGIVAAGKGCGRSSLPGVYTRLNRYLNWIETEINSS